MTNKTHDIQSNDTLFVLKGVFIRIYLQSRSATGTLCLCLLLRAIKSYFKPVSSRYSVLSLTEDVHSLHDDQRRPSNRVTAHTPEHARIRS